MPKMMQRALKTVWTKGDGWGKASECPCTRIRPGAEFTAVQVLHILIKLTVSVVNVI